MQESERAHAIDRRTFLRRLTLGAAALTAIAVVGEQLWEQLARLARRPALWGISSATYPDWSSHAYAGQRFTGQMFDEMVRRIYNEPLLPFGFAPSSSLVVVSPLSRADEWKPSAGGVLCRA